MAEHSSGAPRTVLFSDVEGSTELHARLGDEEARRILDAAERLIREQVAAHGGETVKALGDGLLVTFESVRAAVEAAVEIQRRVERRTVGEETSAVRVRIGINTGEVVERDGDVYGAAVNAAARIVSKAKAGEVLVSEVVKHLLGPNPGVVLEERGAVELRGLGRWTLHEVVWDETRVAAHEAGDDLAGDPTVLIGREPLLAMVEPAVQGALQGRAELVLLAGEPGIGKTSLARALAADVAARGAVVASGTSWDGEGAPPFWPWIQVLRERIERSGERAAREDLGPAIGEVARLLPELIEWGAAPSVAPREPEEARFRLFDALATYLGRASLRRPTVVLLDDLQWADEASLRLLAFLVRRLPTARLLLLGTYRDVEVDDDVRGPLIRELATLGTLVTLSGLPPEDVGRLIESTTGSAPGEELVRSIHERSGGNPFFVLELSRLLALTDREGVGGTAASTVPDGVREIVERRLARLPQACVDVLTAAAVVGQEVQLELLADVSGRSATDLMELLDSAVRARVLAEPSGPLGPYRFAHDLFREALYDGLVPNTRASLHLAAADALERRGRARHGLHTAELARHLTLALPLADAERVAAAAVDAAERALEQFAYEDAALNYERALSAVRHGAPGGRAETDEAGEVRLVLDLADAQRRAGRPDHAHALYEEAALGARAAGLPEEHARAALGVHELGTVTARRDPEGSALLEQALADLPEGGSPLRARLLASLARHAFHTAPEAFEGGTAQAEEAVRIARRAGDPGTLAFALLALHDTVWASESVRTRLDIVDEMLQAAGDAGDRELVFEARVLRLSAMLELGDPGAGSELDRLERAGTDLHQPRADYYVLSRRAGWALLRGDLAEADRLVDEAFELGTRVGVPDAPLVRSCHVAALTRLRGRPEATLAEAGELPAQDYPHYREVWTALDDLHAGRREDARQRLSRYEGGDAPRFVVGHSGLWELALLAEGFVALEMERGCRRVYEVLLPHADRWIVAGAAVVVWGSVAHHLGLLAAALGEERDAIEHLERAVEEHRRMGARPWLAWSEQTLGHLLVETADAARGRQLLAEAERVAADVRMELPGWWRRDTRPSFVLEGQVWHLAYRDEGAHLPDSKGLRDLARLLERPGEEVHASELVGLDAGPGAPVLDDEAKDAYRRRLDDLEAELADAEAAHDLERAARAREERDRLVEELERAVGLHGKDRRLGDSAERARKAVTARVRDAIARIEEQHPGLGEHLREAVRTGTFCWYEDPR